MRVAYREGQRLRAEDLSAEQDYLIALEERHNTEQHRPGIVLGLSTTAAGVGAGVGAGVAVDPAGRALIVVDDVRTKPELIEQSVDWWLFDCPEPQRAHAPCGAADHPRTTARAVAVPVQPSEPPAAPVDGAVYLGRSGSQSAGDLEYTAAVASVVNDPARGAVMQVGASTGRDRNVFVVSTADAAGVPATRVALDRLRNNVFSGAVALNLGSAADAGLHLLAGEAVPVPEEGDPVVAPPPVGVSFEAVAETPKTPPLPGIYSARTGTPAAPAEQLRFDLGEKRDGETAVRFSIGVRDKTTHAFRPWLVIDGLCALTPPAGSTAPFDLVVDGTIEQAPLAPDPNDPRFKNLLVAAWLEGLQQSVQASTLVALAFDIGPPAVVERGKPWSYSVKATNTGSAPIAADGVLETRTVVASPPPLLDSVSGAITLPVGSHVFPISHAAGDTPAGALTIEVRIFGKSGKPPWWRALQNTTPIQVVDSPTIDLSNVPASVPPGTPFDFTVTIVNHAPVVFNVGQVVVTDNGGASPPLAGTPVDVPASQAFTHHHAAIANATLFGVTAAFTWVGGPASSVHNDKNIAVEAGLAATITFSVDPLPRETAWTFSLDLNNQASKHAATVTRLDLQLSGTGLSTGAAQLVSVAQNFQIPAEKKNTLANIPGIDINQTAANVGLTVTVHYDRGGGHWQMSAEQMETVIL